MTAGRKKLTQPLWRLTRTRNVSLSAFPFQFQRILNSNSGKIVLWDFSPSPSWSAGFPNKVTIPCPNTSSLNLIGLAGSEQGELGLGKNPLMQNWSLSPKDEQHLKKGKALAFPVGERIIQMFLLLAQPYLRRDFISWGTYPRGPSPTDFQLKSLLKKKRKKRKERKKMSQVAFFLQSLEIGRTDNELWRVVSPLVPFSEA